MTLRDRLQADVTAAMRSGDALRRDTLRMALTRAYNPRRRAGRPLTDDELVGVLAREVKTRRESIEAFREGRPRRPRRRRKQAEVAILQEYLPQPLSEDELAALVDEAIDETGASSARDLGKVMGWLSPRTRGRADGKPRQRARRPAPGARPTWRAHAHDASSTAAA